MADSEKLIGTIGIQVSERTDRELDMLVEKLEDVNSAADSLISKTLTLDIKTDGLEHKLVTVGRAINKELKDQLMGGFRLALDEMRTALKEGDTSFKVSFEVQEFSAQFTQAVMAAAHGFSGAVASDLTTMTSQMQQAMTAPAAAVPAASPAPATTDNAGAQLWNDYLEEIVRLTAQYAALSAVVGYYRQGLDDTQVRERMTRTIQFAKTANLAFDAAAEYLTATVNSMDITIERASDVFNYLGDATATGADEVAAAFSKVGGAAKSADLEFEKVASWIAVISSRTREAAEVIGNSLNSILARYRNIKASGFAENEDGSTTVVNDVIKALKAADINAIDALTGQLRNDGDILDELAPKWKRLDSNTQAYIGTVMAGTRMQSRFFNLLENYDAFLTLYHEALEAAGTTSAKYEHWAQNVAAAAYRDLQEEERKAKAGARTAYYDETNAMFEDWGS